MKNRWILTSITLAVALCYAPAFDVSATPKAPFKGALQVDPERPIRQIVVRFRNETPATQRVGIEGSRMAILSKRAEVALSYRRPMSDLAHVMRLVKPLPRAEAVAVVERLRKDPKVLYAHIDEPVYPSLVPNDQLFSYIGTSGNPVHLQWHLEAPLAPRLGGANLPAAWDRNQGAGAIVAVVDTGIFNHPDLEANIIRGYDFVSGEVVNEGGPTTYLKANDGDGRDADPSDPGDWIDANDLTNPWFEGCPTSSSSWHGTHVAGTIAALTNNTIGVASVAPQAKVLAVRVLGKCGGYTSDVSDGIRWAAGAPPSSEPGASWPALGIPNNANPARVINLSLGSFSLCDAAEQAAVTAARAAGAVVVAATGNNGAVGAIGAPASCEGAIAVTAHTVEGDSAGYANVGPGTAISAPGGGNCSMSGCLPQGSTGADGTLWRAVMSTLSDGPTTPGSAVYAGYQGTSMATPHVAGVAALLISAAPGITTDAIRSILTGSTRPHPAGTFCVEFAQYPEVNCGSGMLDAHAALTRLVGLTPTAAAQTSAALVTNGSPVTLTGVATAKPDGSASFTYAWTQTGGPAVTLQTPTAATTTFTAPTPGGTMSFRFVATDGNGLKASATVTVRSNGAPTMKPVAAQTVLSGSALNFTVSATDPENDPLTYVATGIPPGSTFDAATGAFSWPAAGTMGTYSFKVRATDGIAASADTTVAITVTPQSDGGGGALPLWQLLLLGALGLAARIRRRD